MCHGDYGEGVSQGTKVDGKMRRKEDGGVGWGLLSLGKEADRADSFHDTYRQLRFKLPLGLS